MPAPIHQRSIFLINKKFQLRFAFYVCSWLIVLSFAYPLIISNLFEYFIRYLAADPMGPGLAVLEKTREEMFTLLAIMQLVFLSLAFLISIFMSHKIAGPLYKLKKFFIEARNGNIDQPLVFRKKDYFSELVPAYNDMMSSIRNRMQQKQDGITTAVQKIELLLIHAGPDTQDELKSILADLKEVQKK